MKIRVNKLHLLTALPLIFLLKGCDLFNGEEEDRGKPIARVYDRYLYKDDILDLVPADVSETDSIAFVQGYINVWARNQLVLYKAEFNLSQQQKDFEEQIEDYRNELLKFAYEQQYVDQNLDTLIHDSLIVDFYKKNPDNLILRENILKAHYIILPADAPEISEARKWFRSEKTEDRAELKDHALKYAREFALLDSNWISYDRIAKKLPIEAYDQSKFLRENTFVEISDSLNVYLLEIVDYKIKDSQSPLAYVEDLIRNILINRRKLQILADLEKNLLEDAIEKKEFETY